jgi:TetR/AcrR family transcriptional repressor of nem operon
MGRTSDARQRLIDAANDLIWAYSYGAITIDAICERAAVKKGSFYYFFSSKSELAVVAINSWWTERHALLERIFHPDNPPLARIRDYLDFVSRRQLSVYEETGQIPGCPVYGLGAEISTQNEELRLLIVDILRHFSAYFEDAIRQAQALGHVGAGDPAQKAQRLNRYYAGVLTQARIENSPEPIRLLAADGLDLIGATAAPAAYVNRRGVTPAAPPATLARS